MKSKFPLPAAVSTEVWDRIERSGRIALFLDFDGTLAPIVSEPSLACLPEDVRRNLQALAARTSLAEVCATLSLTLRDWPGVIVENKGVTATVHYRMAPAAAFPTVRTAVASTVGDLFRVRMGRKAVEILPASDWNKGSAARWIMARLGTPKPLAIGIGDDATDEDLFRAIPDGISIKVGAAATSASYWLSNPEEVSCFLYTLVEVRAMRMDQ